MNEDKLSSVTSVRKANKFYGKQKLIPVVKNNNIEKWSSKKYALRPSRNAKEKPVYNFSNVKPKTKKTDVRAEKSFSTNGIFPHQDSHSSPVNVDYLHSKNSFVIKSTSESKECQIAVASLPSSEQKAVFTDTVTSCTNTCVISSEENKTKITSTLSSHSSLSSKKNIYCHDSVFWTTNLYGDKRKVDFKDATNRSSCKNIKGNIKSHKKLDTNRRNTCMSAAKNTYSSSAAVISSNSSNPVRFSPMLCGSSTPVKSSVENPVHVTPPKIYKSHTAKGSLAHKQSPFCRVSSNPSFCVSTPITPIQCPDEPDVAVNSNDSSHLLEKSDALLFPLDSSFNSVPRINLKDSPINKKISSTLMCNKLNNPTNSPFLQNLCKSQSNDVSLRSKKATDQTNTILDYFEKTNSPKKRKNIGSKCLTGKGKSIKYLEDGTKFENNANSPKKRKVESNLDSLENQEFNILPESEKSESSEKLPNVKNSAYKEESEEEMCLGSSKEPVKQTFIVTDSSGGKNPATAYSSPVRSNDYVTSLLNNELNSTKDSCEIEYVQIKEASSKQNNYIENSTLSSEENSESNSNVNPEQHLKSLSDSPVKVVTECTSIENKCKGNIDECEKEDSIVNVCLNDKSEIITNRTVRKMLRSNISAQNNGISPAKNAPLQKTENPAKKSKSGSDSPSTRVSAQKTEIPLKRKCKSDSNSPPKECTPTRNLAKKESRSFQESERKADATKMKTLENGFASTKSSEENPLFDLATSPRLTTMKRKLSRRMKNKKSTNMKKEQMYIDIGQKDFGHVTCATCCMVYTKSQEEDEAQHAKFHQQIIQKLQFKGWKNERVVQQFHDGRIIMVASSDHPSHLKKLAEVKKVVDAELGFVTAQNSHHASDQQAFLFVAAKKVIGCAIALNIKQAFPVIPQTANESESAASSSSWCCSANPVSAICGISRIWVFSHNRRQKIASRLVDCIRYNFLYGCVIAKDKIAFSDPTPHGRVFAERYTGRSEILVFR